MKLTSYTLPLHNDHLQLQSVCASCDLLSIVCLHSSLKLAKPRDSPDSCLPVFHHQESVIAAHQPIRSAQQVLHVMLLEDELRPRAVGDVQHVREIRWVDVELHLLLTERGCCRSEQTASVYRHICEHAFITTASFQMARYAHSNLILRMFSNDAKCSYRLGLQLLCLVHVCFT